MPAELREALRNGYERMVAWADVLDRINLFPVPDGDTGRNLVLSLAPLRDPSLEPAELERRLLLSARGNSGNIACEFVRGVLGGGAGAQLAGRFVLGAELARKAVAVPKPGTMLTVLDALSAMVDGGLEPERVNELLAALERTVQGTVEQQEVLKRAGVVDSGALGTLIFLDGLLRAYFGVAETEPLVERFRSLVRFQRDGSQQEAETGCCIDAVVRLRGEAPSDEELQRIGSEVVTLRQGELWKVHLHAEDEQRARAELERLGEVLRWSWDDLHEQISSVVELGPADCVHVMTDGAASVSRKEAEALGVTLLDSHVLLGDRSVPETRMVPEDLYAAMVRGVRVATSQASMFERHQHYERVTGHYGQVLYLCVGSAFTGNFGVASQWSVQHANGARMVTVDSGAASGRLAVVVWAVARRARAGAGMQELQAYARASLERAEEYIFLEKLDYLARGGRISKAGAFFGDAIGLTPVVSPMPDGVKKLAMFRKLQDKVAFACDKLQRALSGSGGEGLVLLEYTNNRDWVEQVLLERVRASLPRAECHLQPFSLTTGAHTGPGTWAVAVLPGAGASGT